MMTGAQHFSSSATPLPGKSSILDYWKLNSFLNFFIFFLGKEMEKRFGLILRPWLFIQITFLM